MITRIARIPLVALSLAALATGCVDDEAPYSPESVDRAVLAAYAWDDLDALPWDRSPIAHLDTAKTPALIVHGAADTRVPTGQSTELYRALRHRGVATQLVMYPREGHGISENVHALDFMNRFLDWFDTHLKK